MRARLTSKVALLLIAPSCGAFASFAVFWSFHAQFEPASISIAGGQRVIAVQLGHWAHMVSAMGHDEDRGGLRGRVAEFDRTLTVLERGGEIDGHALARPSEATQPFIASVRAVWDEISPRLLVIADHAAASPEGERAYRDLDGAIEALRTTSDQLTAAMQAQVIAARARVLRVLGATAGLSLALLLLGLWYARRFIVQPILRIDAAARRVHDGDLAARAQVPGGTELSTLAGTFNAMAGKVQDLLRALDLRRRHAETLAESLPLGTALLDRDLAIIRTNRRFQEIFDLGEAGSSRRPIEEGLALAGLRERLLAVLEKGESVRGLELRVESAGGIRPVRITAVATRLAEEEEARLLLMVEDLTEEERLRAEALAAEARLRHLVTASPVAIFSARASDFGVTYVSDNIVQHSGYEPRDFTERATLWMDLAHPDDRARVLAELSTLRRAGRLSTEHRLRHRDGTYRWIGVELTLVRDTGPDQGEIVGVLLDVTEHKEAEAQHRLLERAIEQSANVVVITDAEGHIEYVNPQFTRSTGYSAQEAIGQNPSFLKSGGTPPEVYADLWRTILRGDNWQGILENKTKRGELYWASATVSPVLGADGVVSHFVAVNEDITERRLAERELELFRALLDRSNDAIEVIDAETGRFLDVNERACLQLGYTREEHLALSVPDVDPGVDASSFVKAAAQLRESGSMVWEGLHRRKDGSTFPVEVNLAYVELDRSYLVGVVRDISDRKRAAEVLRRSEALTAVTSRLGEIFLTADEDDAYHEVLKVVLAAMESAHGVFGYLDDRGDLVVPSMSQHIWEECQVEEKRTVFPRDTWGDSSWPRAIREKRAICSNEPSARTPEGHVAIRRHISQPILHGTEVVGLFQVANREVDYDEALLERLDAIATFVAPVLVTRLERQRFEAARRRAEHEKAGLVEQLRQAGETLERRVVERTAELRVANEELESFAYSVSHDLRTPLRAMGAFSELLLEDHAEHLDPKGLRHLERIRAGAATMEQLIDGILHLCRISSGELERDDVDLADLAREIAATCHNDEPDRRVDFVIPDRLPASGDQRLLGSVLQNLLGNAWKFTARQAVGRIELGLTAQQAYFVRDNGAGFDAAYAARLFGPFQRLHSSAEFEGIGIGLATVRRIVRRHGGDIRAEAAVGEGATFTFTLGAPGPGERRS